MIYRSLCLAAALVSLGCFAGCPSCHRSSEPVGVPSSNRGTVVFGLAEGKSVRVHVEIVRTPPDRARGLMFRKELGAREGMLFVFDREEVHQFWMKNTYIPLDMIFISSANKVVGMVENAQPMTTEPRSVAVPSRFVVEVNAGFAKQHGIEVGTAAQLDDQQPVSAPAGT